MAEKAVVVHSLDHARAALAAAAEFDVPLTLLSARGAASFVGALWFRELVALATAEYPQVDVSAVIDCADKPGHVLAALRQGLKRLRFSGRKSTARTLAAIAERYDAELVHGRFRALDLLDHTEPEAACQEWLAEGR